MTCFHVSGALAALLLLTGIPVPSQAEYVTYYLGEMRGDAFVPPVETPGSGQVALSWSSGIPWHWDVFDDTLIVEIAMEELEGTPEELWLYGGGDEGPTTPAWAYLSGGLTSGRYEVPVGALDENRDMSPGAWIVLTTSAHPNGEIAGRLRQENRVEVCGLLSLRWDCPMFWTYDYGWMYPIEGDSPTEEGRYFLEAEILDANGTRFCDRYYSAFRIISAEACTPQDFGWGRYFVDSYDGCNIWRSQDGTAYLTHVPGAADGDSVQVWGVERETSSSICLLYYPGIDVDSSYVFPDTLTPVRTTSWGEMKQAFSR